MSTLTTNRPARAAPVPLQNGEKNNEQKTEYKQWELLPQTELLILWAIRSAGSHGVYGLDIQRAIKESSDGHESVSTGSLYSLLKRLRRRGYVESREGDALGGGAKRQYYFLTDSGRSVLESIDFFFSRLQHWSPEG